MPTSEDELPPFRRLPVSEALEWLAEHGEPDDPRPEVDPASIVRRFPHLAAVATSDLTVSGPHGDVPVRLYRPARRSVPRRALVWVHGGAFIGGHLDMPEAHWVSLELAARGIPVFSVDYRKCLRGVHFPVPSDDVRAAWLQIRSTVADTVGVPPERLALGGASAGGALSAGLVERLHAEGEAGPERVILVYPVLHPNGPAASAELDLDSPHGQLALNYAGSPEALRDPRVFAANGTGEAFPETLVVVCEKDGLRPSGEAFATKLAGAGRPVTLHLEPGADHAHINNPGDGDALRTIEVMSDFLGRE